MQMNPQFPVPQQMYPQPPIGMPRPQFQAPMPQFAPPLYVGNLDENIREEALYDLFSKYGQIYYIKLMRDSTTGKSRGFAYVNFMNLRDAENAKHLAQYELLGRKNIRIMYKAPNIKQLPSQNNIFIKNVDKAANIKELHAEFLQFGSIFSAKLAVDEKGESLGYGYIQFENRDSTVKALLKTAGIFFPLQDLQHTEETLKNALEQNPDLKLEGKVTGAEIVRDPNNPHALLHLEKESDAKKILDIVQGASKIEYKFKEKLLDVTEFKPRTQRANQTKNNLYVKELPNKDVNELTNEVNNYFSQHFGAVKSGIVRTDERVKRNYGFVCFESQEAAQKAFDTFNSQAPEKNPFGVEAPLYVNYFQTKRDRELENKKKKLESDNRNNLFLKNLKPETTKEKIQESFGQYGEIVSIACKDTTINGKQMKFGFVAFKTVKEAEVAKNESNKSEQVKQLFINEQLFINIFQPKEQRSKFLQIQHRSRSMMPFGAMGMQFPQQFPHFGGGGHHHGFPPLERNLPMGGPQQQQGARRFANIGGGFNAQPGMFPSFPPQGPGPMMRGPFPGGFQQQNRKPNNFQRGPYQNQMGGGMQLGQQQRRQPGMMNQMGGGQFQQNRNNQNRGPQQNRPGPRGQPQGEQPKPQPTKQDLVGAITFQDLKKKIGEFNALDNDKKRNILGELLFPLIKQQVGEAIAPKITGMLIDLDVLEVSEIFEFLDDPELLKERITEAKELIENEQEGDK